MTHLSDDFHPDDYRGLLERVPAGQVFVGGSFRPTPQRHAVRAKADGTPIAEVGYAAEAELDAAVQAARDRKSVV